MVELRLPKSNYTFETLVRVAHRMGHSFSISITDANHEWVLEWEAPDALAEDSVKRIRNEIYDQILRDRVQLETKPIRDLIFAAAFSNLEIR